MKQSCNLEVQIKKKVMRALIDTGADCSCISSKLVSELNIPVTKYRQNILVQSALSNSSHQSKWVFVATKIGSTIYKLKFCIIDGLNPNIIIGRSHCEKLKIDIKFSTGTITIQGEIFSV